MKSVGNVIKETRVKKKLSKDMLERRTKIKKEFISALEEERWHDLPEFPVVVGFVKNISGALNLDEKHLTAFLRRDYPPTKLSINPKPDISEKFKWSPRLTFIVGVVGVCLVIAAYLAVQYMSFIQPPKLSILVPKDGEVVREATLTVSGETDPDAVVLINNQPTIVEEDGKFTAEIEIFEGTSEIKVLAKSRSGKETSLSRMIKPELGGQ